MPAFPGGPSGTITTMKRFLQEVRLDYVWMPGSASREFGINDVDLSATFAIPFLHNPKTPLLITPGFAVHYWSGPSGLLVNLPPRVYDAYLGAAWNPQLSPVFSGELGCRVGIYSDFQRVTSDSLRYQGYGLGALALSPSFTVKAGVVYLDRQNVKLLPAGGIVWTPSPDIRFEILFPNPKLAMRLPAYSSCEWWGYVRGEYGGGSWTIKDNGTSSPMDYNDMRAAVGVEFATVRRLHGLFETGVAFERELYGNRNAQFDLNSTVFVRAGLAY
jgi:hypothetical protein